MLDSWGGWVYVSGEMKHIAYAIAISALAIVCHALITWAPALHATRTGEHMAAAAAWMQSGSRLTVSNAYGLPETAKKACYLHALRTGRPFAASMLK